uniref:Uncharacterized protein n=1 Tax=Timema bartmani TaxID=61472 RepID=A0A7R9I614_9NEOP|nr:unnamed protein product [Timema bartmani]
MRTTRCKLCDTHMPLDYNEYHTHVTGAKHIELLQKYELQHVKNQSLDGKSPEGSAFRNNRQSPRLALLSALTVQKRSDHFLCEQGGNSSDSDEKYKESAGKNISSKRDRGKHKRSPKTNKQAISVLSNKFHTQRVDRLQSNNPKIQVEAKLSSKDTFLAQAEGYDSQDKLIQNGGKSSNDDVGPLNLPTKKEALSKDCSPIKSVQKTTPDQTLTEKMTATRKIKKNNSEVCLTLLPDLDLTLHPDVYVMLKSQETLLDHCSRLSLLASSTSNPEFEQRILRLLEDTLKPAFGKVRATLFGSRASGLALTGSDLDIFIDLVVTYPAGYWHGWPTLYQSNGLFGWPPLYQSNGLFGWPPIVPEQWFVWPPLYQSNESPNCTFHESQSTQQFIVRMSANVLRQHPDCKKVCDIPWARTPIVKLLHAPTQLNCDLTFKNGISVENTKLLRCVVWGTYHFCSVVATVFTGRRLEPRSATSQQPANDTAGLTWKYDERVKQLVLVVRLWSKLHMLTASNKFTNYALTVMTLFYLMTCRIIPPVEFLHWKYTGPKKFISAKTNSIYHIKTVDGSTSTWLNLGTDPYHPTRLTQFTLYSADTGQRVMVLVFVEMVSVFVDMVSVFVVMVSVSVVMVPVFVDMVLVFVDVVSVFVDVVSSLVPVFVDTVSVFVDMVSVFVDTVSVFVDMVSVFVDTVSVFVDVVSVFVDTVPVFVDTVSVFVDMVSTWLSVFVDVVSVFVDTLSVFVDVVSVFVDVVAVFVDTVSVFVEMAAVSLSQDSEPPRQQLTRLSAIHALASLATKSLARSHACQSSRTLTCEKRWEVSFLQDIKATPLITNKQSMDELVAGFFHYYATYDYATLVVCPLRGQSLLRDMFRLKDLSRLPLNYVETVLVERREEQFRYYTPVCVQDPFDLSHNLTKAVSPDVLKKFIYLCNASWELCNGL